MWNDKASLTPIVNNEMLQQSLNNNWDYRFLSSSFNMPKDANKFGLRILDTTANGMRSSKKKYKDLLIPFQFVEEFPTWSKTANWNSISDVIGRFEDLSTYANSSAQESSILISYYAEAEKRKDGPSNWSLEDINILTRRIQSLVYPQNDKYFSPPFKAVLNIGKMYIDFPVVIKSVSMPHEAPFFWKTAESMYRKITIELRTSYPSWQAITAESVYNSTNGSTSCFARKEYKRKSYNY